MTPEFDAELWPDGRRAKVLQRYWLSWVRGAARTSRDVLGASGVDCVQHGLTIATYAWLHRLTWAFADGVDTPAALVAARLFAGIHQACGIEVELRDRPGAASVTMATELLTESVDQTPQGTDLSRALLRAWSGPCQLLGVQVARTVEGDRSSWTFS